MEPKTEELTATLRIIGFDIAGEGADRTCIARCTVDHGAVFTVDVTAELAAALAAEVKP